MKFSDSKMLHGFWAEQIAVHLSSVNRYDENHCRSLPFLLATKGTQELADHFEQTYHLSKQNRLADAQSRATYIALGGNALHLVNPIVIMNCYDTQTEEEQSLTVRINSPLPIRIQYMDTDIAETKRIGEEETYFGPHVLGMIRFGNEITLEDYVLSGGAHTVLVPFYGIEVADTQPTGAFN